MQHMDQIRAEGIDAYLQEHQYKELLRFITCGSVDDGKSTLIGRSVQQSSWINGDQRAAWEAVAARGGPEGGAWASALLVEGWAPEREQGTTTAAASPSFPTNLRKFIAADTPA